MLEKTVLRVRARSRPRSVPFPFERPRALELMAAGLPPSGVAIGGLRSSQPRSVAAAGLTHLAPPSSPSIASIASPRLYTRSALDDGTAQSQRRLLGAYKEHRRSPIGRLPIDVGI